MSAVNLSILANANKAMLRHEPYPHIVIENALDEELFSRLAAEYPSPAVVMNGRRKRDTWFDYPACLAMEDDEISPLWKQFMAYHVSNEFYQDVVRIFGEVIQEKFPVIEDSMGKPLDQLDTAIRYPERIEDSRNLETDVSLECQFYVNYSERPRTVRGPHVDRPSELYAALLYFRDENDESTGSDLQICEAKEPKALHPGAQRIKADRLPMEVNMEKVDICSTVQYEANTLVLFLNSATSIHAVSPRSATVVPRRHVNFTADLFNLPGGLFKVDYPSASAAKKWLEQQPVIWRLARFVKG